MPDVFDQQVEVARLRLENLTRESRGGAGAHPLMMEALEELSIAIQELQVASEEMRRQTEGLATADQNLQEERQRAQELFDFAPEAYLVTDENGCIEAANRAASDLLRVPQPRLAGKLLRTFLPNQDAFEVALERLGKGERLCNQEMHVKPRRGVPCTVLVHARAIGQRDGPAATRLLWLLRDVSETEQRVEALRWLCAQTLKTHDEERRHIALELQGLIEPIRAVPATDRFLVGPYPVAIPAEKSTPPGERIDPIQVSEREIRSLSHVLYPLLLDDVGLVPALCWYADQFSRESGVRVDFELPPWRLDLARESGIVLFRFAQEALSNVRHHSGARKAVVQLVVSAGEVGLEVADEGQGIPPGLLERIRSGTAMAGAGLAGIRERLRSVGGRLEIDSTEPGTRIRAIVPPAIAHP